MENIAKRLNAYITAHPFDSGDGDCETVLDQLYQRQHFRGFAAMPQIAAKKNRYIYCHIDTGYIVPKHLVGAQSNYLGYRNHQSVYQCIVSKDHCLIGTVLDPRQSFRICQHSG